MTKKKRNAILLALCVTGAIGSLPTLAAGTGKAGFVAPAAPRVSDRLIVKLRPNYLPKGLSVAQINAELIKPFTAQTLSQISAAAGVQLTEVHSLAGGAHVLTMSGTPNRKMMNQAIAGISTLANVEYVEEDKIMTAQAVPNDLYYTTGPTGNPGLWGLHPVTPIATPAPGATGSYGADFENAWTTSTGNGVVVAVIDTGITPNVDIVGPAATVAAGAGSNLVSIGYDFTSDCRIRGSCPAATLVGTAVAPSPNATDLGDFLTAADVALPFFAGGTVSNSSWHGTHVAGTIAALGNNSIGVIGGAYNAKILPVRALGKGGGYISDIVNAAQWAAGAAVPGVPLNPNPAKVINMSLGGTGACSITEQNAINAAVAAGVTVVVAAGNSNADVAGHDPANCANVISVASVGRDGSRATYSNFSSPITNLTPSYVTLAAQGGDQAYAATFDPGILSTLNTGLTTPVLTAAGSSYVYYQGTSMATPHVSAAVALMLSRNPNLTPAQVRTILTAPSTVTPFPGFTGSKIVPAAWDCAASKNCGAGILNAKLAVQNSIVPLTASTSSIDFGSPTLNTTVNQSVTFTNSSLLPVTNGVTTITGPNAALFTIVSDTCNNATIAVGGTCQVTTQYAPVAAGSHTATLSVPTNVAGVATSVGLSGTGGAALTTPTPAPVATTVNVGQSTTVAMTFTNGNAFSVKVTGVTLSNPTIMATSADNCSNTTLIAGASCNVTVTVTPTAAGGYTGTVSVMSGAGTVARATITGTANTAPAPAPAVGGGGGGGCSVMPAGSVPDSSLPLAMLIMLGYWMRRRSIRGEA